MTQATIALFYESNELGVNALIPLPEDRLQSFVNNPKFEAIIVGEHTFPPFVAYMRKVVK